tara:strand:+ start:688 stop:897 length:210 start_codon:yes stop_codon:yes gene_type:complete
MRYPIMDKIDDGWMRPSTKSGTEEMRKRLKAMRTLLDAAAKTDSIETKIAQKVFNEYFSFDWDEQDKEK